VSLLPHAPIPVEDRLLIAELRTLRSDIESGADACEMADELYSIIERCRMHPSAEVRTIGRQLAGQVNHTPRRNHR